MAAQSYTAFWSVWCSWFAAAFLQASLIYLCGFHLWGSIFMGAYFAFKGTVLGVCASAIYASGGARALVVYWLLNCLPELVLSTFMLWLAHSSCRVSQSLSSIVFSGCRCALNGAIRRLSVHYLLCLLGCAVSSFMFSGSAVLFASVQLLIRHRFGLRCNIASIRKGRGFHRLFQLLLVDMGINLRRGYILVPQDFLDGQHIHTALIHECSGGMAQFMWRIAHIVQAR